MAEATLRHAWLTWTQPTRTTRACEYSVVRSQIAQLGRRFDSNIGDAQWRIMQHSQSLSAQLDAAETMGERIDRLESSSVI